MRSAVLKVLIAAPSKDQRGGGNEQQRHKDQRAGANGKRSQVLKEIQAVEHVADKLDGIEPALGRAGAGDVVGKRHRRLAVEASEQGARGSKAREDAGLGRLAALNGKRAHKESQARGGKRGSGTAHQAQPLAPAKVDAHDQAHVADCDRHRGEGNQPRADEDAGQRRRLAMATSAVPPWPSLFSSTWSTRLV